MSAPDFDQDNTYGQEGERIVRDYGRLMARGEAGCEVKRKTRPDLKFYVETEQRSHHGDGPAAPGGINATTAQVYAYVLSDTGIVIVFPTALLRQAIVHLGRPVQQPRRHNGNPTVGVLAELAAILNRYEPDSSGWPVPPGGWKELEEITWP